MKNSNKSFIIGLIVLLISSVSFSQTVNLLSEYEIKVGNDDYNLRENAIYVQKSYPYGVYTAHNSDIDNSILSTFSVRSLYTMNEGANWNYVMTLNSNNEQVPWSNGLGDPSIIFDNNVPVVAFLTHNGNPPYYTYHACLVDFCYLGTSESPVNFNECDKPFLWFDRYNNRNRIFVAHRGAAGTKLYLLTNNGFENIWTAPSGNDDEGDANYETGIQVNTDVNGCIYIVWNTASQIKFTKSDPNYNCIPSNGIYNFISPITIATNDLENHAIPTMSVSEDGYKILIAWTSGTGDGRNISFSRSVDGGDYFDYSGYINSSGGKQFMAWLTYAKNTNTDLFAVSYYNNYNSGKQVSVSYTTNAGDNWSTININQHTLTSINFDSEDHDYMGIDAVYKNNLFYIYPVYADLLSTNPDQFKSYISPLTINISNEGGDDGDNIKSGKLYSSKIQNYPNPFNPVTKISFSLKEGNITTLKVYDISGKEIISYFGNYLNTGEYSVEFNGSNLPSGVYFYKLVSGNFIETKRMILTK